VTVLCVTAPPLSAGFFLFLLLGFLFTNLLTNMLFTCEGKSFFKFVSQGKE